MMFTMMIITRAMLMRDAARVPRRDALRASHAAMRARC